MRKVFTIFLRSGLVLLGITGTINAGLIINEIYYDQPGADGTDVFTEIYNPGQEAVNLAGWSLVGINGSNGSSYKSVSLAPAGELLPKALLLIAGSGVANADFYTNVDWQNGPDAVQLIDDKGGIVDAVQYGNALSHNSGEGIPALDVTPGVSVGYSLSRDILGTDTNDNFTDFSVGVPSPGTGPTTPVSIPVPSAVWLLSSGCLGLLVKKRRQGAI